MQRMTLVFVLLTGLFSNSSYAQNDHNKISNTEIVEKFLNGFNDKAKIEASLALLAEDYKFKNPMILLESKSAFISLAQDMSKVLTAVNIIRISENEDWVAVLYEFKSSIPGLESNIGTEWFKVENGVIQESELIYDASEWRKVYEQMSK